MTAWLSHPWPWYVAGPLLGLFVPLLLVLGNKPLGMSATLRALCAAALPGRIAYFRYDWRRIAGWNLAFAAGILVGAALLAAFAGVPAPAIAIGARRALAAEGLGPPSGLAPPELFGWPAVLHARGALCALGGGFLVGFGSAYAGGCTSGHGIMGIAARQLPSLVALLAIFAGGLFVTWIVLPALL